MKPSLVATDPAAVLRVFAQHRIQPSAQRVAFGCWVLATRSHRSADEVYAAVKPTLPVPSRATVYNTLHLLVENGVLKQLVITDRRVVFDPVLAPHHHFVDNDSGQSVDVSYDAVAVAQVQPLDGLDVRELQVARAGAHAGDLTTPSSGEAGTQRRAQASEKKKAAFRPPFSLLACASARLT